MLEKKQETTQELYNRVKAKRYKILRHIAMEIRVALDKSRDARNKAEVLKDISNAAEVRKAV